MYYVFSRNLKRRYAHADFYKNGPSARSQQLSKTIPVSCA